MTSSKETKTLKLSFFDRYNINSILPAKANLLEGKIILELREKLDWSSDLFRSNMEELPNGGFKYRECAYSKDYSITLTSHEISLISRELKKMEKEGNLPTSKYHHELFELILNL